MEWAVGLFWASSAPDRQVLILAQGDEIQEFEKRTDFIRWVGSSEVTSRRVLESAPAELDRNYATLFEWLTKHMSGPLPMVRVQIMTRGQYRLMNDAEDMRMTINGARTIHECANLGD